MADEKVPTALDKLGTALTRQLTKVIDDGIGPLTGSRDYAEVESSS